MHKCLRCVAAAIVLASGAWAAAAQKEDPVGLVLSPGASQLLRADTETAIAARAGDLLFPGDGLKTGSAAASFLFCPAKTIDTLSPAGEVRFDAKQPKIKAGKISEQPARACALPQTLRVAVASQQHYGVTMTRGALDTPPVPRGQLPPQVLAEMAPLDAALAAGPGDPAVLIAMAGVFEKHNLPANALEQYTKLRAQWPDAVWIKSKAFELEELAASQATAVAAAGPGGKTYALLVGISKYSKPELALQFANADATVFGKLLASPRGGALPPDQILTLTDEKATTAAVRNGFHDFLDRRAGKQDTVVLLIAGHGTVEVPGSKSAFILTYDSDPQDLASTALPVTELQQLFEKQLKKVGRVLLFVDVCKAGVIGSIQSTTVSADVQHLGDVEGDLFGLLASRPKEVSLEGPQFGGGHGSFSYFVMKGLGGAADANKDGAVDADELIRYVINQVPAATNNKQHPREFGTYDNAMRLSDLAKPGIDLSRIRNTRTPLAYLASAGSGWALVDQDAPADTTNQQRIALEDRAQEVLLRYLAGDQNPPTPQDYANGARYMEEARKLTRESLFLEARQDFFEGRAMLFDKQRFAEAAALLEQSVRLDPGAAYAYNALGIAYLEQAQFDKAIPAFRDAARRARHWSYPLHNLALAYVESGAYRPAIAAYQEAIRLSPKYPYLPYNLGLLYQRLNRTKEAEDSYRKAISLAPDSAEAYNAMGTLKAAQHKNADAERWYRDAISRNPALLPARHNLALLLAADRSRRAEAVTLWNEILRQSPDYLPSLISLAEYSEGAEAVANYRRVVALKPQYTAARLALGTTLLKAGDPAAALEQFREASRSDTQNASIYEQIGDAEAVLRHPSEAQAAYQRALELASTRAVRKRLAEKLRNRP